MIFSLKVCEGLLLTVWRSTRCSQTNSRINRASSILDLIWSVIVLDCNSLPFLIRWKARVHRGFRLWRSENLRRILLKETAAYTILRAHLTTWSIPQWSSKRFSLKHPIKSPKILPRWDMENRAFTQVAPSLSSLVLQLSQSSRVLVYKRTIPPWASKLALWATLTNLLLQRI